MQFVLSTPVVLWAGWPFFERGWRSLVNRTSTCSRSSRSASARPMLYSAVVDARARASSRRRSQHHGKIGVYFEAAAVITVLVLLGQVLELRARSRTGSAIRALLDLAPTDRASSFANGEERDVPLDEVQTRRSAARAARRESAGRWRRHRRPDHRRRIDAHRRTDAGGESDAATKSPAAP